MDRRFIPKHDPTPEEIRAVCLRIQAGWSDNERQRRSAWNVQQAKVTIREVEVCQTLDARLTRG